MMKTVISCDPGSSSSGLVVICNTKIVYANHEIPNCDLFAHIQKWYTGTDCIVLVEDILPYSQTLKIQVIQVCKFIGALAYRMDEAGIEYRQIGRNAVKQWVFENYPSIVGHRIQKKIDRKGGLRKDGKPLTVSFLWVDDRIVAEAMRYDWGIKKPKPGHKNEFGISKHSWQALGLATYWIRTEGRQPIP